MTVAAIHPDSASLEFHSETGGPAFREFAELIDVRAIEVYGRPSAQALEQLEQKVAMLGADASVVVHDYHAGFTRLISALP
jgi:hypothetical protein